MSGLPPSSLISERNLEWIENKVTVPLFGTHCAKRRFERQTFMRGCHRFVAGYPTSEKRPVPKARVAGLLKKYAVGLKRRIFKTSFQTTLQLKYFIA